MSLPKSCAFLFGGALKTVYVKIFFERGEIMIIRKLRGHTPEYGDDCYFAENAVVVGDVVMGDKCSVWYNAVIRGDVHSIRIGNRVNIQDGAVVHCTYRKFSVIIGNNVSIGHNAIVHGCIIEDNVLVGMGAVVMDGCKVESNSIIAAGAVVTQGSHVKSGTIWAGIPARQVKEIDKEKAGRDLSRIAENYVTYSGWYR